MTDVLTPADAPETAAIMRAAAEARTPLAVEGGGTKAAMGRPAQAASTLSTRRMAGITLYEPAELVIAARSGTPLAEIERTLAERGQMLPFEPLDYRALLGSVGEPTVGGLVGANLSGPRRIAAGACRDSLIGVKMVNGRGEEVVSGGRVMKNVTGLDLARLLAGSWGTLAVFTEITFKVSPAPAHTATLVLHGLDDRRAIDALSQGLGSPFEVSGAAHLPGVIERVPKTLLRLEGFPASVAYRMGELRRLLSGFGRADVLEGDVVAALWRGIRDATFLAEPRDAAVWRVSIAPSKAAAFVAGLSEMLPFRHVYDWGGGLVWVGTSASDAGVAAVRAALVGSGGHATLVRAPAEVRASAPVFDPPAAGIAALTAGVKASFDPAGILNPGRMYAGL
ncbi:glycolate oxidase subunit GlcE [uncultured Alsobacter sp.]|uniref:glycolate oxidase subunit GlcE n=1 Tax=uncultured Alsobacter sp. TaxID=1748258 RepID=UPI0025E26453|nr:glycolate oxidase subunit GlcE [uncultured Alsobacter sp.]